MSAVIRCSAGSGDSEQRKGAEGLRDLRRVIMDTNREIDLLKQAYSEFFGELAYWLLFASLMLLVLAVVVTCVTIYAPRVLPKPPPRHEPEEPEAAGRIRIRDDFDW
jgi:hypothetical protein